MGSRLMHLIVADYVARDLDIGNHPRMLLGAVAPDAAPDKTASHFQGPLHPHALNAPLEYGRFVVKYRDRFHDPYFIGYLTHLVMDDVWTMKTDFNGFEARIQADPSLYQRYHADLWLCNAKLIGMYALAHLSERLSSAVGAPDTDEVAGEAVMLYRQQALDDFDYPEENVTEPLKLFTLEDMVHYVERCKSKALDVCRVTSLL